MTTTSVTWDKKSGLRFILRFGIVSLFADLTYEGAHSVTGPFLATLGATGLVVGIVSGLGEMLGYALRLISGRTADRTRLYWPITLGGYFIQLPAVPALALAPGWPIAAVLIVFGAYRQGRPQPVARCHAGPSQRIYR